jgi:PRC-barrel domain protein
MEVAMTLPNPEQVKSWGGKLLVDRTGQPIGTVTQVYTDDATGLPEWATTRLGEATVFLPLKDAVEADGRIRVAVHRDDVAKSPAVVDKQHITPDEEARLYRHYGIPYTPERSRSGLPVGEGPLPSRITVARRAAADAGRRLTADRPTVALTALAALLATLAWAMLRRGGASDRTAS